MESGLGRTLMCPFRRLLSAFPTQVNSVTGNMETDENGASPLFHYLTSE